VTLAAERVKEARSLPLAVLIHTNIRSNNEILCHPRRIPRFVVSLRSDSGAKQKQ
jgi:hypothetical protein